MISVFFSGEAWRDWTHDDKWGLPKVERKEPSPSLRLPEGKHFTSDKTTPSPSTSTPLPGMKYL